MRARATEILKSESEMLDALADKVYELAAGKSDDAERTNLECWGQEFRKYSETNKKYIDLIESNEGDVDKLLREETKLLKSLHDHIPPSDTSEAAEYWRFFLEGNRYYTEKMLA